MDIAVWLRGLGLERYERAFRDNEIDRETLPKLTAEDLKDLGVVLGTTVANCSPRSLPYTATLLQWNERRLCGLRNGGS